ncbi:unnamed protein product [Dovyalis caffra]|uniref:SAC domain-containing protein n=1 Tax=Dovyalis caffra TaxID=77055 RepID=A0AAV1SNK8_9ROSI|nr:unnamed protein product [Dovyalis caffra]
MERAESGQKLYTRMRLWEFPDQYVIEPTDGSSGSALAVNKADGSMCLIDEVPECSSIRVPKIRTIFGVIGMLKLVAGSYLIVITDRECVGSYLGYPIYKATSLKILPCDQSVKNSNAEQRKMETEFSGLLNVAERTSGLYFSYDTNLTLRQCMLSYTLEVVEEALSGPLGCAQRLHDLGDESKLLPLWRQNFQAAIGKEIVDVTLIARRCTRRNEWYDKIQAFVCAPILVEVSICPILLLGTRMWRRGADSDGYVANFVETEQIVQMNGFTSSFVQERAVGPEISAELGARGGNSMHSKNNGVRGSIPFLWEQVVDLTYKPKFEIVRPEEAPRVVERHFLDLRKKYGAVFAVDLVNKHGGEGRLSEKFANAMHRVISDDVRYLHFDFHKICGHVHFERLSILYDQIVDFLEKNGYLLLNEKGEKMKEQTGVVRTNCIDCLDRTNVTQGILNDGKNALARYYFNNFCDGTKQDANDLLQGHYIVSVSRDMAPPAQTRGLESVASFPVALALVLTGFFLALMSLRQVRYDLQHLFFSIMWAGLSVAIGAFVKANGRTFCNQPRLNKPRS